MAKGFVSKIIGTDFPMVSNYKVEVNDYTDYYEHLECGTFDVVMVEWKGHAVSLFVDDEGLLKPKTYGRKVEGYPEPLFGNIVAMGGVDDQGNTMDIHEDITLLDIGELIGEIQWVTAS